jgi:hypothetical protein
MRVRLALKEERLEGEDRSVSGHWHQFLKHTLAFLQIHPAFGHV